MTNAAKIIEINISNSLFWFEDMKLLEPNPEDRAANTSRNFWFRARYCLQSCL